MRVLDKDKLILVVKESKNKKECLIKMGISLNHTHSYRTLNYYIKIYDIDTNHFISYGTNHIKNRISLEDILKGLNPLYSTNDLKKRLIKEKIFNHKCSKCERVEWNAKPIPLDLDHINGDSTDHRLENLRLLCRNCHAQTDTFCGKNVHNKGSKKSIKKLKSTIKLEKYKIVNESKIKLIELSNIDFSIYGWVNEVAILLNMHPQKINKWMIRWMPKFYNENCFKRKNIIKNSV